MPMTVLYPEDRQIPDDTLEREIFGPEVRIVRRTKTALAELDPADCAEVDGLMIMRHAVSAEDIARFPRLRAIVRMGVGYDKIDRPAAAARNILVCNVPDYGTTEVADHAMALALSLRRGVVLYHERLRSSPPAPWGAVKNDLIRRLGVQNFGILGLGRIGTAVALRARAFGFRVSVLRSLSAERRRSGARHRPRRDPRRSAAPDRHLVGPHPADPRNPQACSAATSSPAAARGRSWSTPRAGRSSISTRFWHCCATAISPPPGSTCCRSSRRSTRSRRSCAPTASASPASKGAW